MQDESSGNSQVWNLAADLLDPPKPDVFGILGYKPNPKQEIFHAATEFDVLYGGAAYGGKTKALLMEGIRACMWYPGIRVLAIRRTFDELAESFYPELQKIGYASAFDASWNKTDKQLTFPNGSLIRFRFAETIEDATRRQGGEYQLLLVDERTLLAPGIVDILVHERIRSATHIPELGVRSSCNPGGPSHGEVKDRYIVPTNYGQRVIEDEAGRGRRFVPAKATDNPAATPEYLRSLDSIPDPQRRAAMRDGSWDIFSGQVFTEWRNEKHVVTPFAISSEWERGAGIDYGYAKPWAVVWGSEDSDGRVWIYRELYATQVGETDQARRILSVESGEEIGFRAADPAMWAKVGDAAAIAETYGREECHLEPAHNDRLSGWQRVHSYLANAPACAIHRAQGLQECPKLHVFSTCENLIRTLPALPYDLRRVEDVDTKAEDHAADALRYLLMHLGTDVVFHSNQPKDKSQERALDGGHLAEPFGDRYAIPARRSLWEL
ncbi:MAG: hypothetical protein ACYDCC_04780 [Actinomycetota bacterium]